MESIFDLPAHALAVHAPIVLQPLVAVATLLVLARSGWRERFTPWLAGAVAVVVVATLIAINSGEAFDDLLDGQVDVSTHESLALTTRNLMVGWLLAVVAIVATQRWLRGRNDTAPPRAARAVPVLGVVASVLAVLSTVWMIRTGHEGARVVWSGVIEANRN